LLVSSRALIDAWESAIEYDPPDPAEALDYHNPAIMLRAMALECLLKARALECGVVLARNGRYVPIEGVKQHDLDGLAKRVGFEVDAREAWVLRRLSRWVTAGRYPIQQRWTDQVRLRTDGLLELLSVGWHPDWDDACEKMLARLAPWLHVED
jgi:hypothetical protein